MAKLRLRADDDATAERGSVGDAARQAVVRRRPDAAVPAVGRRPEVHRRGTRRAAADDRRQAQGAEGWVTYSTVCRRLWPARRRSGWRWGWRRRGYCGDVQRERT